MSKHEGNQQVLQSWKPYIAFLIACIITTVIPIILPNLKIYLLLLYFGVLPVLFGNAALFFCSKKKSLFVPSLIIRIIYLAIVVIFNHQFAKRDWNLYSDPEIDSMIDLFFTLVFVTQCIVLLVSEPALRWMLRERAENQGWIKANLSKIIHRITG